MLWLLVFFFTPSAEMYLLIEVAGYIDVWPTIGLVMLTAVIGVALLKRQGVATLTRGVSRLNAGEVPATEMAEGILLAVAGALLITPGFFTDTVGFLLLFPPTRVPLAQLLLKRAQMQAVYGAHSTQSGYSASATDGRAGESGPSRGNSPSQSNRPDRPITLEGEFERKP